MSLSHQDLILLLAIPLVFLLLALPILGALAQRRKIRDLITRIRARGPIRNIAFPVGDPGVHHNIGPFVVGFEGDEKVIIPLRCYVPPGEICEHGVSADAPRGPK